MPKIYLICNTNSNEPIENKYLKAFPECIFCDELFSLLFKKRQRQDSYEFSNVRFCFITGNAINYKSDNEQIIPIKLPDEYQDDIKNFELYDEKFLYPILHSKLPNDNDIFQSERKLWKSYSVINQAICDFFLSILVPEDIVITFDYSFLLLPHLLRKEMSEIGIGTFFRCPFPSSEIFRTLVRAKEIIQGALGSNVVGFQTFSYAKHFVSACTRILGLESNGNVIDNNYFPVNVVVNLLGNEVNELQWIINNSTQIQKNISDLKDQFFDKSILLGFDVNDQWKSIKHKLQGLEYLLTNYPECRDKFVYIEIIDSADIEKIDPKVTELATKLNRVYGSLNYLPIVFYTQKISLYDYLSILSVADIYLSATERSGIPRSMFDFVLCQKQKRGSIVLSEFCGFANFVRSSIIINPWSPKSISDGILKAFAETARYRRQNYKELELLVESSDSVKWLQRFVSKILLNKNDIDKLSNTPHLELCEILSAYGQSTTRLILLDYDGTLVPIVKVPSAAAPNSEITKMLKQLTSNSRNFVYVISGRDQYTLDKWLGFVPNLGMSAEHGCFIKYVNSGDSFDCNWISLLNETELSWKKDILEIFEYFTERTPGSFIEQKSASVTWHYRLSDPEYGSWQANECRTHIEQSSAFINQVEIITGKKNIEVRPNLASKGKIINMLLERHNVDFIFCAGDDKTDEDMFKALSNMPESVKTFTCKIGNPSVKTSAKYRFNTSDQMVSLLMRLGLLSSEVNRQIGMTL